MSVRRCPNCGRRQLSSSNFLSQPFTARIQCHYCDSGFTLKKGWIHYFLIGIIWFGILLIYSEVSLWETDVFLKILTSSSFTIFALLFTSRLGRVQPYGRPRQLRPKTATSVNSAERRFYSPYEEESDERMAI